MEQRVDLRRDEDEDQGDSEFSVRLLDRQGRPARNRAVVLGFTSPMRGITDEEFTDAAGIAAFHGYRDGEAKVFVNGHDMGTYYFSHNVRITVTI